MSANAIESEDCLPRMALAAAEDDDDDDDDGNVIVVGWFEAVVNAHPLLPPRLKA